MNVCKQAIKSSSKVFESSSQSTTQPFFMIHRNVLRKPFPIFSKEVGKFIYILNGVFKGLDFGEGLSSLAVVRRQIISKVMQGIRQIPHSHFLSLAGFHPTFGRQTRFVCLFLVRSSSRYVFIIVLKSRMRKTGQRVSCDIHHLWRRTDRIKRGCWRRTSRRQLVSHFEGLVFSLPVPGSEKLRGEDA